MSRVRFPLSQDWLRLTQEQARDEPGAWARDAAVRNAGPGGEASDAVVAHLEAVARHYLDVGGIGCLLLVPGGTPPVRAMVRLEVFAGPETAAEFRSQCEAMFPPLSWLVDPVAVTPRHSAAGPVTRVHVRTAEPGVDPAPVRDTLYWCWWFADVPETFVASVAFADVTEAGRWLPEIENVLLAAQRVDGPVARDGEVPEGEYAG